MNEYRSQGGDRVLQGQKLTCGPVAFTVLELLVALAMIALLGSMLLPALARTRANAMRITCADNLKRISEAFKTWANNHGAQYPMVVANGAGGPPMSSTFVSLAALDGANTQGGTHAGPYLYTAFAVMSNELSIPKFVVCPTDERVAHTNFMMSTSGNPPVAVANPSGSSSFLSDNLPAYFDNFKISYFLGVNATDSKPQMLLAGDRNIGGSAMVTAGGTILSGYGNNSGTDYYMGTSFGNNVSSPAWTPAKMHQGQGNVLLVDGSVQQLTSARFRQQCTNSNDTTSAPGPNTLLFP